MAELFLPGVFWPSDDVQASQDALVIVADGEVIHITRADGFEVRFLVHELVALAKFVAGEVERFDEENARDSDGDQEEEESDQEHLDPLGPIPEGTD